MAYPIGTKTASLPVRRGVPLPFGCTLRRGAILATLAISVPGIASAQETQTGSRLNPRKTVERDGNQATKGAHGYATCLVRLRRDKTATYLQAKTAKAADDALKALTRRRLECQYVPGAYSFTATRSVNFSSDVMRGMLAEQLLQEMHWDGAPLSPLKRGKVYHASWNAASGRNMAVDDMAMCVAATDPQDIRNILSTSATSDAEGEAIGAIMPALGPCLVANAKLKADKLSLRAALAEALYQRRVAKRNGDVWTGVGDESDAAERGGQDVGASS